YHRQRLHLVLTAIRRFAAALRDAGFDVDHRRAPTLLEGLAAHRAEHRPGTVRATEPLSWGLERLVVRAGVELVRSNQFLCHRDEFATWASGRRRLVMEDFYRQQRQRLGYLMDGDQPVGGRWNFDAENREPPPRDGRDWPEPVVDELDDVDREVLAGLPPTAFGADPEGWWPTSRAGALARLDHVVTEVLPGFGPHEDAMLTAGAPRNGANAWRLNHSMLSSSLNIGLLLPGEVCDAVEVAYRSGRIPLASAEGFLRQVIGWREYVWGIYWLWMPAYRRSNELGADRPLPPAFTGAAGTQLACVAEALGGIHDRAWVHHIQRLMVLANFAMLSGVSPQAMSEWMAISFVDGSEWVMVPNLIGMAMHADGGRMATKPYAGGGAYINRMSDHCSGCRYDPRRRVGDDACPFTTLYWDFLARHRDRFDSNSRMRRAYANLDRLADRGSVPARAREVLGLLDAGRL
ncbi:MAG: cryptochrome/photolyase family protein, partial [Acidimicrobiia bacterium]|nr:cryptochrome/photolyase family protein [Acidimicrobiia bacterium]